MWWQTKRKPLARTKSKTTKAARVQAALDERYNALITEFIERRAGFPDVEQLRASYIMRELEATGRTIYDMQASIRERRGSVSSQGTDG